MPYLLIILGGILIALNIKAIRESLKEDKKFNNVLKNVNENMTDTDVAIGELRKEFAETILELQKEMISIKGNDKNYALDYKENINSNENLKELIMNSVDNNNEIKEMISNNIDKNEREKNLILDNDEVIKELNKKDALELTSTKELIFNSEEKVENEEEKNKNNEEVLKNDKNSRVQELLEQGFSVDEICDRLSLGKGEVLLIKELLKNSKKN